jgi:hypothetical protein
MISTTKKAIIVLGLMSLIGLSVVFWLATFRLNQRQILFEVWHGNVWTGTTTGFFVDSEGAVYSFRNESRNALERFFRPAERGEAPFTANELFKFYGKSNQFEGTIDATSLKEMINLIQPASVGTLSNDDPLTSVRCTSSDAGIYTYTAYLYDPELKVHIPVTLYTMGDFQEVNLSQEGVRLHHWPETTCGENGYFSGCNPPSYICRP